MPHCPSPQPGPRRHHQARRHLACLLVYLASLGSPPGLASEAERSSALLAEHAALQANLQASPFGEPLLLRAGPADGQGRSSGEVLAVLPRPLASVVAPLRTATGLCGLLLLQLNVRGCQPEPGGAAEQLQVRVGPMRESLPGLGHSLHLALQPGADAAGYFSTQVASRPGDGPLAGSNLQLQLEAVALAPGQTYLHIRYSHSSGSAARLATRFYLATSGRHKIGFSSDGLDGAGRPQPVTGERAALERNVMRHYLGLLVGSSLPATPAAARLRAWHALTERHAAQLHEIDLDDYLAEKQATSAAAR